LGFQKVGDLLSPKKRKAFGTLKRARGCWKEFFTNKRNFSTQGILIGAKNGGVVLTNFGW